MNFKYASALLEEKVSFFAAFFIGFMFMGVGYFLGSILGGDTSILTLTKLGVSIVLLDIGAGKFFEKIGWLK